MKKYFKIITFIFVSNILFSIANAGSDGSLEIGSKSGSSEINDCFEKINRGIFAFNQGLDKVIFKPVASVYRTLPSPIKTGVSNSLDNLSNLLTIPNNLPPLTRDGSVIAKTAVPKIMLSLSIINFFGAYYVTLVDYIPYEAMYGHILLGIFPLAPAYFILFDKIEIVDK